MSDASDFVVGAALEQLSLGGDWEPLGFFSKKLSPTQQRYSTYDRELLSIYLSLKHFSYILEACNFSIHTDHKPLTYAFMQRSDKAAPRQQRQLSFIAQFTTDIQHISGQENIAADALSRINQVRFPTLITPEELSNRQATDPELAELLKSNDSSLK